MLIRSEQCAVASDESGKQASNTVQRGDRLPVARAVHSPGKLRNMPKGWQDLAAVLATTSGGVKAGESHSDCDHDLSLNFEVQLNTLPETVWGVALLLSLGPVASHPFHQHKLSTPSERTRELKNNKQELWLRGGMCCADHSQIFTSFICWGHPVTIGITVREFLRLG